MKKFIALFAFMLIVFSAVAQKIETVPTASATFKQTHRAGDIIINYATGGMYMVATGKIIGTKDYLTAAIAASKVVGLAAFGILSSSDTTGIRLQSAHGTWYRLWISDTGTVGTATCTTPE